MPRLLHTTAGKLTAACIGQRVALTVGGVPVAGTLSDFDLAPEDHRRVPMVGRVVLYFGGRRGLVATDQEITLGDLDLPGGAR